MRKNLTAIGLLLALSACGGSGSSGIETTPPPPAPTNSTVTDLKVSQTFQNDATGMSLALDLTTKTGISGEIRPNSLTVRYDAQTKSYSVAADGRSESFAPDNIQSNVSGETIYQKSSGMNRHYLTVATTPYTSNQSNRYVGLAFWQDNIVTDTRQDMDFYIFTYGLPTSASAMPRTGTAGFRTDVFGAVSMPGQEPRAFQGDGDFSVDFATGVFATHSYLTERALVTGSGVWGGGIEFTGAGHLASSGGFSGNALYEGEFGSAGGPLNGRFYGPNSEEVGGAFSGSNKDGLTVVGGFTGQRDPSIQPDNLTLTNLTSPQLFFTRFDSYSVGQLNQQDADNFTFSPPTSGYYGGQFTSNDKVASSDPNFTEYRKTFSSSYDSQNVNLKMYKPGGANTELALTYTSFGHYSTETPSGTGLRRVDLYGAYGLETPIGLLSGKTGTASYRGVVYGTGQRYDSNVFYDVKGTSQFSVDFGAQSFAGALIMTGSASNGSGVIDFGGYDVAGRFIAAGTGATGTISRGGTDLNNFFPRFYGPDGEEIAAGFSVTAPVGAPGAGITIQGVAVAKQQ